MTHHINSAVTYPSGRSSSVIEADRLLCLQDGFADYHKKGEAEREGDEATYGVSTASHAHRLC